MRVSQRNASANAYDWVAIYDGLGRRLRTTHTNVTAGVPAATGIQVDSWFDPEVEFLEVGVALNGARTWKVLGPDLDGEYGSAQGVGALEATVRESDAAVTPVVQDQFGNVLATVSGGQASWTALRVSGYGPVLGDQRRCSRRARRWRRCRSGGASGLMQRVFIVWVRGITTRRADGS